MFPLRDKLITGYILQVKLVRAEDVIVTVLGENFVCQYYRFYGARHSIVHLGFKIGFEELSDNDNHLPQIRNISHIPYKWLLNNGKQFIWQQFISFLYIHLKDTHNIDSFYFTLIDDIASKLHTQNAKRAIIEGYIKILDFEGIFTYPLVCTMCHKEIHNQVSFARGLKPFHTSCMNYTKSFDVESLENFFILKNSFFISDIVVDDIFDVLF